jgi:hypothetical protein
MYCLLELLTVVCSVVLVATILFVVSARPYTQCRLNVSRLKSAQRGKNGNE